MLSKPYRAYLHIIVFETYPIEANINIFKAYRPYLNIIVFSTYHIEENIIVFKVYVAFELKFPEIISNDIEPNSDFYRLAW